MWPKVPRQTKTILSGIKITSQKQKTLLLWIRGILRYTKEDLLSLMMDISENPQPASYLAVRKWMLPPLRSGTRHDCLLSPFLCNIILDGLSRTVRQERNKTDSDWKGRDNTVSICRWHNPIENFKKFTKLCIRTKFSKIVGYKVKTQNQFYSNTLAMNNPKMYF